MKPFHQLITQSRFDRHELARMIAAQGDDHRLLLEQSARVTLQTIGDKVWLRGLIEFSNICIKNCYYCGIRRDNRLTSRYELDDDAIVQAALFARDKGYGSIVLQAGERNDAAFVDRIGRLLCQIHEKTHGELGITLSLGEQDAQTYRYWKQCGAHRYLLRFETSCEQLYYQMHPHDHRHDYQTRLQCLQALKACGYQVGTGVMIGLPGQSFHHLADDLLMMLKLDVDMVGMGPYLEHQQTPLYQRRHELWPVQRRFQVALNMIASLRLLMPDINIAASTALQAIDPMGREKALRIGANVLMPNITPSVNRRNYQLYDNKPCVDEGADDCSSCIRLRVEMVGRKLALGEWGDSQHFFNRNKQ
ncbi:MAG: [FeFe] hydrogenase H-cluster radical SAM maturase HydE [Marinilabiliaceae bacterium]|nr:[FeFe] hydrogenase H-cluster radical SAM maturase HydE [Marinilabiliaceae bacterium]